MHVVGFTVDAVERCLGQDGDATAITGPIPFIALLYFISHRSIMPSPNTESEPLLPPPVTQTASSPTHHRSKLNARRTSNLPPPVLSEKSKGKQRAIDQDQSESLPLLTSPIEDEDPTVEVKKVRLQRGRHVTVIFSGEGDEASEGNLEIWVEDGESVGTVKEQVSVIYHFTHSSGNLLLCRFALGAVAYGRFDTLDRV